MADTSPSSFRIARGARTLIRVLACGFLLQYLVAIGSSWLVYQQGLADYPDSRRDPFARWILAHFVHDSRSVNGISRWPKNVGADDRPDLRIDPPWNPFDASVWRDQPQFAMTWNGTHIGAMQASREAVFSGKPGRWLRLLAPARQGKSPGPQALGQTLLRCMDGGVNTGKIRKSNSSRRRLLGEGYAIYRPSGSGTAWSTLSTS